MKILDLLAVERIIVPLRAKGFNDAAGKLATTIVESMAVADPPALREAVKAPDSRSFVATGQAFLVHVRSPALTELAVAIGVSEEPIRRDKASEQQARIVMLVAAPPQESSTRLRAVSAFALLLSREAVLDVFLNATSPQEIVTAESLADIEVPAYLTVNDVMDPRRLFVQPDTTLGEASQLMVQHGMSQLPVVSDTDEVLGVVTHRELLRQLLPIYVKRLSSAEFRSTVRPGEANADPNTIPVRDIMDRSILCVSDDQALAEVATMMVNRDVERVPVVRDGALVGLLNRGDIVRTLLGS